MSGPASTDAVSSAADSSDARFPIGRFAVPREVNPASRAEWIRDIEALPQQVARAIEGLSDEQLDTPYRDGGWTVRQVVHHIADSHINAYTRFRLALTEPEPTIRPYEEARWAELTDARTAPPDVSLSLLKGLHARWTMLLRSLGDHEWLRTFRHPEHGRTFSLHELAAMYAWHSRHHVAHITSLRRRRGW